MVFRRAHRLEAATPGISWPRIPLFRQDLAVGAVSLFAVPATQSETSPTMIAGANSQDDRTVFRSEAANEDPHDSAIVFRLPRFSNVPFTMPRHLACAALSKRSFLFCW